MAGAGWRSRTVVAPDGRSWTVRRVLLPRPPRWKGRPLSKHGTRERASPEGRNWLDALDGVDFVSSIGDALGGVGALIAALALVVVLFAFAYFVVFPVLFFVLDLLVILLIAAGGVAVRVLFRRPWLIESRTDGPPEELHTWGIVGVRASAQAVDTVAGALRRGTPPDQIRPAPHLR